MPARDGLQVKTNASRTKNKICLWVISKIKNCFAKYSLIAKNKVGFTVAWFVSLFLLSLVQIYARFQDSEKYKNKWMKTFLFRVSTEKCQKDKIISRLLLKIVFYAFAVFRSDSPMTSVWVGMRSPWQDAAWETDADGCLTCMSWLVCVRPISERAQKTLSRRLFLQFLRKNSDYF